MAWKITAGVKAAVVQSEGWKNSGYVLGKEGAPSVGVGHFCSGSTPSYISSKNIAGTNGDLYGYVKGGGTLSDDQVIKLLDADLEHNMQTVWSSCQNKNYSAPQVAVLVMFSHWSPKFAKEVAGYLAKDDMAGAKSCYLSKYSCKDPQFNATHKRRRENEWQMFETGKWHDPYGKLSDDQYVEKLKKILKEHFGGADLDAEGGGFSTGGGSFDSSGGQQAGGGVSKFWYLGAAHNILNNAQMEKLYVECKLRGCNLSLLRGEKVPVLMIDKQHKVNVAEQDNAFVDPTTMMDTWASGWFMIGGLSYIYDPIENPAANKWTTIMKLQRMEWPTPTEVTDPSARNVRSIRYNIGMGDFKVDEIAGIDDFSLVDSAEAIIGVNDCTQRIQKLVKLMDKVGVKYRIVSGRRYPINENGEIVKSKAGTTNSFATVTFGGAYAFKCANGIRFFRNPISDHSIGDAIDIIQQDGENFNRVLSDIISSDEILIHMYETGLVLYEETAIDDLGAATSHFHIGTNVNFRDSERATIAKNWWNAVMKVRETKSIKGYLLTLAASKAKSLGGASIDIEHHSKANDWVLRKLFTTDNDWQNQSFNRRELSYDDWVEKAQKNLQMNLKESKSKYFATTDPSTGKVTLYTEDDGKKQNGKDNDPIRTLYSENTGVDVTNAEAKKLSSVELQNIDLWDRYAQDCMTAYNTLNLYYNSCMNNQMKPSEAKALIAMKDLKNAAANIKVILDANPSSEIINSGNDERLIKRNLLDTKYRNALTLLQRMEALIKKGNVDIIKDAYAAGETGVILQTGNDEGSTSSDSSTNDSSTNDSSSGSSFNAKIVNIVTNSDNIPESELYAFLNDCINKAADLYSKCVNYTKNYYYDPVYMLTDTIESKINSGDTPIANLGNDALDMLPVEAVTNASEFGGWTYLSFVDYLFNKIGTNKIIICHIPPIRYDAPDRDIIVYNPIYNQQGTVEYEDLIDDGHLVLIIKKEQSVWTQYIAAIKGLFANTGSYSLETGTLDYFIQGAGSIEEIFEKKVYAAIKKYVSSDIRFMWEYITDYESAKSNGVLDNISVEEYNKLNSPLKTLILSYQKAEQVMEIIERVNS